MKIQKYVAGRDQDQVLDVINRDRLQGQPSCSPTMLSEAIQGLSQVDRELWLELGTVQTWVVDDGRQLVAAFSAAERQNGKVAELLWLHATENGDLVRRCIGHFVETYPGKALNAFSFSTPLTAGLGALPKRARPVTFQALQEVGFVSEELWSYWVLSDLQTRAQPADHKETSLQGTSAKWIVSETEANAAVGRIEFSLIGSTGVIWEVSVIEERRAQGIGRGLINRALDVLAANGASNAVLYVDEERSQVPGSQDAAKALYRSLGFLEVDRLNCFELAEHSPMRG